MAHAIEERPSTVVIERDRDVDREPAASSLGTIIGVVLLIILILALLWWRPWSGSRTTNVNVSPPNVNVNPNH